MKDAVTQENRLNKDSLDLPCSPASILLPRRELLGTDWAVVACDQFTSDPAYWQQREAEAAGKPSALHLVLPEAYLGTEKADSRLQEIGRTAEQYLRDGIFAAYEGCILVERTTPYGNKRQGIVLKIDLTQYDYREGNTAPIRATEGTVTERIPPRVRIREGSPLELPHVLLLIDDPQGSVLQAAVSVAGEVLYDFALNGNGGRVQGRLITDFAPLGRALTALKQAGGNDSMLMAVGDGNHSLAAAKACYERALQAGDPSAEQKRYALVEVENLYDEGLRFEPIHRAVTGVDTQKFLDAYRTAAEQTNCTDTTVFYIRGEAVTVPAPAGAIEGVRFAQDCIDAYLQKYGGAVDYIHGLKQLKTLAENENTVALQLKAMDKSELFAYILSRGVLPRKTFSMGEAEEKRYYIEARCLRPATLQ